MKRWIQCFKRKKECKKKRQALWMKTTKRGKMAGNKRVTFFKTKMPPFQQQFVIPVPRLQKGLIPQYYIMLLLSTIMIILLHYYEYHIVLFYLLKTSSTSTIDNKPKNFKAILEYYPYLLFTSLTGYHKSCLLELFWTSTHVHHLHRLCLFEMSMLMDGNCNSYSTCKTAPKRTHINICVF